MPEGERPPPRLTPLLRPAAVDAHALAPGAQCVGLPLPSPTFLAGWDRTGTRARHSGNGAADKATGQALALGDMAGNGGPTSTMLPLAGHPAITPPPSAPHLYQAPPLCQEERRGLTTHLSQL